MMIMIYRDDFSRDDAKISRDDFPGMTQFFSRDDFSRGMVECAYRFLAQA